MTDIERLRLQLLANGYTPIRNRDKRTFMTSWPKVNVTPEEITGWSRYSRDRATGIRVENGLAVIDIDIDDPDTVDALANAVFDAVPALADPDVPLLQRRGKGAKEAWFVRTADLFGRIASYAFTRPGETVDDGVHRIEIFGGGSPRQFGAFGPHTVDDDGTVRVEYAWADASPADTPRDRLPELGKDDFYAVVKAAEGVLRARGWQQVLRSVSGESASQRLYDIVAGMSFDLADGTTATLDELRERARNEDGLRCSAAWLEDGAVNRSRCLVSLTRSGHVAIWESASDTTHIEIEAQPKDVGADVDRVAEKLRELRDRRRYTIRPGEDAMTTAAKLRESYVYCAASRTPVYPMHATPDTPGISMANFRMLMLTNTDEDIGPRGGRVVINPVDLWMHDERRVAVDMRGVRPDKPSPVFTDENGLKWQNLYQTPAYLTAEGGSPDGGVALIAHLLPDGDERAWFTQWLAYKFRNPHIPGPAVVMVAHGTYGTGRGTLAKLLGRLFGSAYVRQQSFENVAGRTSQSQYTDWQADSLLTFIAEARDTSAMSAEAWTTKHNAYERLKEIVEAAPVARSMIAKGKPSFTATVYNSLIIATNHIDAIVIPANDRRFAILRDGGAGDAAFWDDTHDWMAVDANIAAFGRWLHAVDLEGYSPYVAPPQTVGKSQMVELGRSDLDRAFTDARRALVAPVFTIDQFIARVAQALNENDYAFPPNWRDVVRKMLPRETHRVGVRDSTNWQVFENSKKYGVYTFDVEVANMWRERVGLSDTVRLNGPLNGGGPLRALGVVAGGKARETGE